MFVKFAYLLGYIKIYFYKLVYRNNFTFGKKILPSFDISINMLENSQIVIGDNFYFRKGIVLRLQNESSLIIGNNVFFNDGCKITCLRKIHIGNDVLISPNTFVNLDVPDHSIVIGNPCKIISRQNATQGYVNFLI